MVTNYIENHNIPDLNLRGQETRIILLKGKKYADVMILVFRKREMYRYASQKRCTPSNFRDRK